MDYIMSTMHISKVYDDVKDNQGKIDLDPSFPRNFKIIILKYELDFQHDRYKIELF